MEKLQARAPDEGTSEEKKEIYDSPGIEEHLRMVFKCSVVGCFTNYAGYDKGTVFRLPDDTEQRKKWIRFLNRSDHDSLKMIKICYKHFEEKALHKTPTRVQLNSKMKPVPTIIPSTQKTNNLPPFAVMETLKNARKPPTARNFGEDELLKFNKMNSISSFDDIILKGPQSFDDDFKFEKKEDHLIIYKLEEDTVTNIPQVTYAIRIHNNLRLELFFL